MKNGFRNECCAQERNDVLQQLLSLNSERKGRLANGRGALLRAAASKEGSPVFCRGACTILRNDWGELHRALRSM